MTLLDLCTETTSACSALRWPRTEVNEHLATLLDLCAEKASVSRALRQACALDLGLAGDLCGAWRLLRSACTSKSWVGVTHQALGCLECGHWSTKRPSWVLHRRGRNTPRATWWVDRSIG